MGLIGRSSLVSVFGAPSWDPPFSGRDYGPSQQEPSTAERSFRLYEVLAMLPERDGELQYRIKSEREPYQRIMKASELEPADI
jgi:hypothetical protein